LAAYVRVFCGWFVGTAAHALPLLNRHDTSSTLLAPQAFDAYIMEAIYE
jgi:hypothetical protein